MIFYFSATGNSLEAARTIASVSHDALVDIGRAVKTSRFTFSVEQGTNLGFVVPTYAWSTPRIVDDFVRNLEFTTPNGNPFVPGYSFVILTCGSFVGNAARFLEKLLRKHQGIRLDSTFSIQNVDSCIFLMGPGSPKRQEKLQRSAHSAARAIGYLVDGKRITRQERRTAIGALMSVFTCHENKAVSTKPFSVDGEACIHCGLCEERCPTNTIHLEEGLPVWERGTCTWCMACVQRCPTAAIQYGASTRRRARYTHPILSASPTFHSDAVKQVDMSIPDPEPIVVERWEEPEVEEADFDPPAPGKIGASPKAEDADEGTGEAVPSLRGKH